MGLFVSSKIQMAQRHAAVNTTLPSQTVNLFIQRLSILFRSYYKYTSWLGGTRGMFLRNEGTREYDLYM